MIMAMWLGIALLTIFIGIALLVAGRPYWAWVMPGLFALAVLKSLSVFSDQALLGLGCVLIIVAALFGIAPFRATFVSRPIMRMVGRILPKMGDTERIALEAGTVWWDGDLFSACPDWQSMFAFQCQRLADNERAFLDGPVEELCRMVDEWQTEQSRDLPLNVWEFIRNNGFFGIIIPQRYGGLGFSAIAHSAIVVKVSSASGTAGVTVMVPNSLGPAELILHYGTDEQKDYYLPRLAHGEEIPCFALTEPEAGSDAASATSEGTVCTGFWEGREVLGMRLTWKKRYITLAPVATVIGLAFRLLDPDHILGDQDDLGISCALIPSHLPGIEIGMRHDALFNSFLNGPTCGRDVFVPLDCLIGGPKMAGQGWRMLMECLAAGRSISLPAVACAAGQVACRGVGAYATIREQFDTPIGKFEGIEEPLARIGGFTYMMDAARRLTAGAVDAGQKPAVVSAIVKRYLSETQRLVINDAMDILAGAGICRGPNNIMARAYMAAPISITVEGANILTRCLIIFGQGAIRCHPYVLAEMRSIANRDLPGFDRAFWGHVGFVFSNMARAFVGGLTDGFLVRPNFGHPYLRQYLGQFSRLSAAFVLAADLAMGTLGAQLKRAEKLSGRLADCLAWLYLGTATMKRFYDEGQTDRDLPYMQWAVLQARFEVQEALSGLIDNLPNRPAAWLLRLLALPFGRSYRRPGDALGAKVARGLLEGRPERLALSPDIFSPDSAGGLGRLEMALNSVVQAIPIVHKIKVAIRSGILPKTPEETQADRALQLGVLTQEEVRVFRDAQTARNRAIQVDAFEPREMGDWLHEEGAGKTRNALSNSHPVAIISERSGQV